MHPAKLTFQALRIHLNKVNLFGTQPQVMVNKPMAKLLFTFAMDNRSSSSCRRASRRRSRRSRPAASWASSPGSTVRAASAPTSLSHTLWVTLVTLSTTACLHRDEGGHTTQLSHPPAARQLHRLTSVTPAGCACTMLWLHAVAPCCGSMLWLHAVAPCCGSMLWLHAVAPCCVESPVACVRYLQGWCSEF